MDRRRRWMSRFALALLALIAELAGRSLAHRLDVGRHVGAVSYARESYYPFVLAAVKVGVALMLARVAWRFARAHRVASLIGGSPRVRFTLSARLWFVSFATTSLVFLVQMDVEGVVFGPGRWPLFAPWLHSSALPVFAVLSVLVALLHRTVELWLRDYERLAEHAAACLRKLRAERLPLVDLHVAAAPRRLFGLAFESRPPPLAA